MEFRLLIHYSKLCQDRDGKTLHHETSSTYPGRLSVMGLLSLTSTIRLSGHLKVVINAINESRVC